ncbi:MAG TPA: exodeoxyribonuclease III [Bdellovibrionales bacterium]|nr:MAG: exodeoxyribonuclease III [Bdellovibrionales bacterium GWB1_52_6]OFZ03439.1 MAG: exodeoxyribonuclease III [Bdellovibrionales bacterium GWA1_52_35]OFZ41604.1 MAG: exodeoxyribonuclease III [Bdellovibrionales bacterium GWC1_52_8]HAR42674.1 exodeoxyribonuclease III [Bdellovibrionales bacterium]HCM41020.1 exodeoxyribonuclease III [Bdellovibrionales bacterium]
MKLITWNVNGIRAAQRHGFIKWFEEQAADVVCLQEIKATPEQLDDELKNPVNYHSYWNPAQKPGYSGTAIFSKREPLSVTTEGLGIPKFDSEGRVMIAEYPTVNLVNAYFPNSQRDHARLDYKIDFCAAMLKLLEKLRKSGKPVVLCGDFNIAHKPIDLRNPKANEECAGYLPEERAWMDELTGKGYVDTFRHFTPDPHHYTWWSYRPGVRTKNIGWRLDYFVINQESQDRLKNTLHQPEVKGSDHCPVLLQLK